MYFILHIKIKSNNFRKKKEKTKNFRVFPNFSSIFYYVYWDKNINFSNHDENFKKNSEIKVAYFFSSLNSWEIY